MNQPVKVDRDECSRCGGGVHRNWAVFNHERDPDDPDNWYSESWSHDDETMDGDEEEVEDPWVMPHEPDPDDPKWALEEMVGFVQMIAERLGPEAAQKMVERALGTHEEGP